MNKEIFTSVFKNKVLFKTIFDHVQYIHRVLLKKITLYKWKDMITIENLHVLVGNNYIDLVKKQLNRDTVKTAFYLNRNRSYLFRNAIIINNLEFIKYLIENLEIDVRFTNDYSMDYDLIYYATVHNRMEILKYLDQSTYVKDLFVGGSNSLKWKYKEALAYSPESGNIEMIKYINEKVIEQDGGNKPIVWGGYGLFGIETPLESAAESGNIEMIEWLKTNRPDDISQSCMYLFAIYGDHLHVVRHLHHTGHKFRQDENSNVETVLDRAARYGRFEILKYLYDNNMCRTTTDCALTRAARQGHLEMVQWLFQYGSDKTYSADIMDNAAASGNVSLLQWLHDNTTHGCTHEAMELAAQSSKLEAVKWLHFNRTEGCSKMAFYNAAQKGHLEVLKWLHENRTESFDLKEEIDYAYNGNKKDVIDWLKKQQQKQQQSQHNLPQSSIYNETKLEDVLKHYGDNEQWKDCINQLDTYSGDKKWILKLAGIYGSSDSFEKVYQSISEFECISSYFLDKLLIKIISWHGNIQVLEWIRTNRTDAICRSEYILDGSTYCYGRYFTVFDYIYQWRRSYFKSNGILFNIDSIIESYSNDSSIMLWLFYVIYDNRTIDDYQENLEKLKSANLLDDYELFINGRGLKISPFPLFSFDS